MVLFSAPDKSGQGIFNPGRNSFSHRACHDGVDMAGFKDMYPDRFTALNDIYGPDACYD